MKKFLQISTVVAFVGFLSFLGFMTLTKEQLEFSYLEQRNLAQRPAVDIETITDGTFSANFESYFQDQFYKRIGISKYYYLTQVKINKTIVSNVLVGENGWITYVPVLDKNQQQINQSIEQVNTLNTFALNNNVDLYLSINPYKNLQVKHVFPYHPASHIGAEIKSEVLRGLDENLSIIDNAAYFKNHFTEEEREALFYKTDHHWNYLGAFETYTNIINELHKKHPEIPKPLVSSELKKLCATQEDAYFLGSQDRSVLRAFSNESEPLCTYTVKDLSMFSEAYIDYTGERVYGIENIYNTDLNRVDLQYGHLTSWDIPEIVLKMKEPPNSIKALIIKDSYTNAMQPYIATHFAETRILDMRHYNGGSIEEYIKEHDIDLVLLSHNETMVGDTFLYSGKGSTN